MCRCSAGLDGPLASHPEALLARHFPAGRKGTMSVAQQQDGTRSMCSSDWCGLVAERKTAAAACLMLLQHLH